MNKSLALIGLVLAAVLLSLGFLFLCAASEQPIRVLLALALLAAGGALAAASGRTLCRIRELDPENLSDLCRGTDWETAKTELTGVAAVLTYFTMGIYSPWGFGYRCRR